MYIIIQFAAFVNPQKKIANITTHRLFLSVGTYLSSVGFIIVRSKLQKEKRKECHWHSRLAEKEGFEPSRRYSRPTPLAGAPLRPLEYFSVYSLKSHWWLYHKKSLFSIGKNINFLWTMFWAGTGERNARFARFANAIYLQRTRRTLLHYWMLMIIECQPNSTPKS